MKRTLDRYEGPTRESINLILQYKEKIERNLDECKKVWPRDNTHTGLYLHDFHPHNTLFHGNDKYKGCVLIYDFTHTDLWDHRWVVAFSLHRFVREHILRPSNEFGAEGAVEKSATDIANICRNCAKFFISEYESGYYSGCGRVSGLDNEFFSNLSTFIKCSNIGKLISVTEKLSEVAPDSYGRSEERILGEFRKFVKFMDEADSFAVEG